MYSLISQLKSPAVLPRLAATESMEHLNQADQHRRTPLHMAAFFGKADAVWNARWRPVVSCELLVVGQRIDELMGIFVEK